MLGGSLKSRLFLVFSPTNLDVLSDCAFTESPAKIKTHQSKRALNPLGIFAINMLLIKSLIPNLWNGVGIFL